MKTLALAGLVVALLGCQRPAPSPALGLPPLALAPVSTAVVDLGRKLFMDRRLSSNNTMSCAMCHVPEQGFAANELGTSLGLEGRTLRRNSPTLLNVAYVGQLFHDGRAETLEKQAWAPLLHPVEMGNATIGDVTARIAAMPDYAGRFEAAFNGAGPGERTVGAALAAYERTLVSGNSRFDRWHYGQEKSALSPAEQAGFAVFAGKGRCIACHSVGDQHALFSDARFHNTGIGWARSKGIGRESARRYQVQLAPGVFTELQEHELASVSEAAQDDDGRFEVTHKAAERWAYRTPSLRNVALTGPYMHDGSLATLEAVIEYYQHGGIANPGRDKLVQPLQLTEDDKRNLAAFLRSLTGDNVAALARQARSERIDHPNP
ncbi:MAG: cytochrome c peroxidase [Pseudomonadota bacterium]